MLSKQLKLVSISIIVLVISTVLFWQGLAAPKQQAYPTTPKVRFQNSPKVLGEQSSPSANIYGQTAKVTRVVDGDTIEVEYLGSLKKLRYIGIDTPETVDPHRPKGCFGKEASNENKRLVEGKDVILEKDVSETDKFGRLLRLVYLTLDDGSLLFVNDYLVRQGFAHASTYPPDVKFSEQFLKAEQEARDTNRGLWVKC